MRTRWYQGHRAGVRCRAADHPGARPRRKSTRHRPLRGRPRLYGLQRPHEPGSGTGYDPPRLARTGHRGYRDLRPGFRRRRPLRTQERRCPRRPRTETTRAGRRGYLRRPPPRRSAGLSGGDAGARVRGHDRGNDGGAGYESDEGSPAQVVAVGRGQGFSGRVHEPPWWTENTALWGRDRMIPAVILSCSASGIVKPDPA
jgi:hypothetical protein